MDPGTINLFKLIHMVLKTRPSYTFQIFFPGKFRIVACKKNWNKVRDMVRMDVRIKEKVNVSIGDSHLQQPPQRSRSAIDQYPRLVRDKEHSWGTPSQRGNACC